MDVVILSKDPELYIVTNACPQCTNDNCSSCGEALLRSQKLITGERFHCACFGNDHKQGKED